MREIGKVDSNEEASVADTNLLIEKFLERIIDWDADVLRSDIQVSNATIQVNLDEENDEVQIYGEEVSGTNELPLKIDPSNDRALVDALIDEPDAQTFEATATGSDIDTSASVGQTHRAQTFAFSRADDEDIDITIGITDGTDDFLIHESLQTDETNILFTDPILLDSNHEVFIRTNGISTGDVIFRSIYQII